MDDLLPFLIPFPISLSRSFPGSLLPSVGGPLLASVEAPTFYELMDQVIALLQQRGRLSYRALKRQFALDDGGAGPRDRQ